jgi:hypothetical protein
MLATAASAIGLAAALGLAAPAHASTLSIQTLACIPQDANLMECFVAATGGTAPYDYHWSTTADDNMTSFSAVPPRFRPPAPHR